jgi:hypothetical protein
MLGKHEYDGEWWFPKRPEMKFRGKLVFTPEEGGSLDLVIFETITDEVSAEQNDLILGSSADGKKITLFKCFLAYRTSFRTNIGINTERIVFKPSFIFIGAHFRTTEEVKFSEMSVRFAYLDEWASISGFKLWCPKKGATIKYKLPKAIQFNINKNFKIKVVFSFDYPAFCSPLIEASIKQSAWVHFCPSTPKSIEEFIKSFFTMQNFLTLAVSEPIFSIEIRGKTELEKPQIGDKQIYVPIGVLFKQQSYVLEPIRHLYTHQMLFTLRSIAKNKRILRIWFQKALVLEPVYNLYFGTFYQKSYLNNEFLNLTQALEAYHRKTKVNYELPEKEHNKRINEILCNTPEAHRPWLKAKLNYSNEPTLRKRLKELWEKCPPAISSKLGVKEVFVGLTVDTRNYWTHFGDDLKASAADNEELYYLVVKLRILIQTCLLQEIGFSPDEVEVLMAKPLRELIERRQKA